MSTLKRISYPYCYYHLIIIALVVLIYLPTFSGEFILDDKPLIEKNSYIKEIHSIRSYFMQEDGVSEKSSYENYHTGYYRPLINLSYWIDYKLWGMNPHGFRTTNVILHLFSCFLLLRIIGLLVNNRQAAFFSTLLFALHPVNTEAVSWVTSRNNILVTFFALSSFYFFIRGQENTGYGALILSVFFFAGAVFSKEFGLIMLPIFFLFSRFVSKKSYGFVKESTIYLPFIILSILYFILRKNATDSVLTPSDMGDLLHRLYFTPYLILLNLKLIFFPVGLHSFMINYPDAYLTWQALSGFTCLVLLGLFLWKSRENNVVSLALYSFLLALFPIMNIIPTWSVTLISMRWLYFPMAFLSLALPVYIIKFIKINRFLTLAIFGLVVGYFGVYSYILNKNLWHDEGTFFMQEVQRFKNNYYAYGYAVNLLNKKDYQEAERYFRIAINHQPHEAKNYINYSALLIAIGRPDTALLYLNKAKPLKMIDCERGQWFNNIGMAYFKLKKQDEALKNFLKAVTFCPKESQYWANLGGAYGALGDYVNSVSALKKGLEIVPKSIQLMENLAVTYVRMEDYESAVLVLEKIPRYEIEKNKKAKGLLRQARNKLLRKDY